jgi:hypothetical protein
MLRMSNRFLSPTIKLSTIFCFFAIFYYTVLQLTSVKCIFGQSKTSLKSKQKMDARNNPPPVERSAFLNQYLGGTTTPSAPQYKGEVLKISNCIFYQIIYVWFYHRSNIVLILKLKFYHCTNNMKINKTASSSRTTTTASRAANTSNSSDDGGYGFEMFVILLLIF